MRVSKMMGVLALACAAKGSWSAWETALAKAPESSVPETMWVHFAGRTPASSPGFYTRPAREPDGSGHAGGLNEDFVIVSLRNSNAPASGVHPPGAPQELSEAFRLTLALHPDSGLTWPADFRLYEDVGTFGAPNRVELVPAGTSFTKDVPAHTSNYGPDRVRRRIYVVFQEDQVIEGHQSLILTVTGVESESLVRLVPGWNRFVRWLVEDDDAGTIGSKGGSQ